MPSLQRVPGGAVATFQVIGDVAQAGHPAARRSRREPTSCGGPPASSCSWRARATAYREFNFSPSGAWAAYEFDDYRAGMRNVDGSTWKPKSSTE